MKALGTLFLLAVLGGVGWLVYARLQEPEKADRARGRPPAPVEVAPIRRGPIEERRTFSGTLEARAELVVAPKVSGRIERLAVDLADMVQRGQIVARLDDDEYVQAVAQAEAEVAVAQAELTDARNALEIAERSLERIQTLRERGVASESQFDVAQAEQLAKQAEVAVAEAQVTRAEAALAAARIRLGYTTVAATWSGGDDERVVAARHVDEGATVSANAPLLSIVEIDPIKGVFHATEKDYARLEHGQPAVLVTDAFPQDRFEARIERIAPVFREATRQARVELSVPNPQLRLKPGMFIRVTVVLGRVEDAVLVPEEALTRREDRAGVFVLNADRATVSWRPVETGIRDGGMVQVTGEGIEGLVVTLGQQLVDDGSPVTIPNGTPAPERASE